VKSSTSPLSEHPSGLFLHLPGFPGTEEWFAGFTTLPAGGTMDPVLPHLGWKGLPVFRPAQVHGRGVLKITQRAGAESFQEEADGLATGRRGIVLAVASADCVPLILFDPRARAGAVLHAGWRGTCLGIAREGVRILRDEWASSPRDLLALIGPCIGPCCYQVGEEVVRAFRDAGIAGGGMLPIEEGPSYLDLPAANRRLLEDAGIPPRQIFEAALCTRCRGDLFPSYRREGARAGRILGFLGSSPAP